MVACEAWRGRLGCPMRRSAWGRGALGRTRNTCPAPLNRGPRTVATRRSAGMKNSASRAGKAAVTPCRAKTANARPRRPRPATPPGACGAGRGGGRGAAHCCGGSYRFSDSRVHRTVRGPSHFEIFSENMIFSAMLHYKNLTVNFHFCSPYNSSKNFFSKQILHF